MVHSQYRIETPVGSAAEEPVGGIGAEYVMAGGEHFGDGRSDHFPVLGADHAFVAVVRVEAQYGNAWAVDGEVFYQGLLHLAYAFFQEFRSDII